MRRGWPAWIDRAFGCRNRLFERRDLFPYVVPLVRVLSPDNFRGRFDSVAIAEYRAHRATCARLVVRAQRGRERVCVAGETCSWFEHRTGLARGGVHGI